jgi:hypothetical protein
MLILGIWRDLAFRTRSCEEELDEQIELCVRAITAVWYGYRPRRWRALELAFWIGGDAEGSYDSVRQRVWFLMHHIAGWAAAEGLTMEQALVLIAGHEAMHAVRHAQGVRLFISRDTTGQIKGQYWTHPQEVEARSAGATLARVIWPNLTLPHDWMPDTTGELYGAIVKGWAFAAKTPARQVLVFLFNDELRPIRLRRSRLLPKLLFGVRGTFRKMITRAT